MAALVTGGIITLLLIFVVAVAVITIYLYQTREKPLEPTYRQRMDNYISRRDELAAKPIDMDKSTNTDSIGKIDHDENNFINVAGYGRIRGCCNQTARLNEQYCVCGRSVPKKLLTIYNNH